jgi:gliding motility-associated-like protein
LPTTPGTYQVTYNTNGACPNTSSTSIIILSAPTANAGPNAHLGCGDTVQLIGSGSSVGSNYIYQWTTLNGNIISGTTNPLALANQSGIYTLTVTDTVTGCVAIDTMTVLGVPAPMASFTTNPNPATGTVPLTVTFTNTSTNANSYLWTFGDGTTSTVFSPTHVFNTTGVYTVVLYAYSGHCIDSSSVIVVVYDAYSVIIPNIFTPNDDGFNDVFYINTTGASAIDVVIFDRWGLKIYEWHTIDGGWDGHNANGVKVSDGTYYYIADVTDGDGKTTQTKGAFTLMR